MRATNTNQNRCDAQLLKHGGGDYRVLIEIDTQRDRGSLFECGWAKRQRLPFTRGAHYLIYEPHLPPTPPAHRNTRAHAQSNSSPINSRAYLMRRSRCRRRCRRILSVSTAGALARAYTPARPGNMRPERLHINNIAPLRLRCARQRSCTLRRAHVRVRTVYICTIIYGPLNLLGSVCVCV